MERPSTDLWEKSFKADMMEWCRYNIRKSDVDNLKTFMRRFMQSEGGRISPVFIIDAWKEIHGVKEEVQTQLVDERLSR